MAARSNNADISHDRLHLIAATDVVNNLGPQLARLTYRNEAASQAAYRVRDKAVHSHVRLPHPAARFEHVGEGSRAGFHHRIVIGDEVPHQAFDLAGQSILVDGGDVAVRGLAADISLRSIVLGVEGVEVLVEPLIGRDPGGRRRKFAAPLTECRRPVLRSFSSKAGTFTRKRQYLLSAHGTLFEIGRTPRRHGTPCATIPSLVGRTKTVREQMTPRICSCLEIFGNNFSNSSL
jgi:hypothetical protein